MRLRFRTPVHKVREKAGERLAKLSREEVLDFADASLSGAWKAIGDYRKQPMIDCLEDAERGLQQVLGALDDLRRRDF